MLDLILRSIINGRIDESNLSRTDRFKVQFYKEKLNEMVDDYQKWKKENVTLRGIKVEGEDNGVFGSWGKGLYTVPLSNKAMAKQYGKIHFIVNGKPKNPKIVSSVNEAEIFRDQVIQDYLVKNNKQNERYRSQYFNENTSFEKELLNLGYDGFVIKGREMVNYTPSNILTFKDELQLKNYYYNVKPK